MSFRYQTGGSLPYDSPTYIERQADQDLYDALVDEQFCYVLTSRQMGKSSLRVHVMQRLHDAGLKCSAIDLTGIGSKNITPDQWYYGILKQILKDLNLLAVVDIQGFWRDREDLSLVQRLSEFVDLILLQHLTEPIVVFVDEIDSTISLPFSSDDFFAWIRYCYNLRADRSQYQRLSFCLLGVATPNDLIQDVTETPFNIGTAIELERFKKGQITPLVEHLSDQIENLSEARNEIHQWTRGQPFLTQRLCQLIQASEIKIGIGEATEKIGQIVRSQIVNNWEFQDEQFHLRTIRNRLLKDKQAVGLLSIYQKILLRINKEPLQVSDENLPEIVALQLTGIVVSKRGRLMAYNHIYQEIFNEVWVEKELAKLRPYAGSLKQWLANNQDNSHLLVGQGLSDAQQWALTRRLSDIDYQYLTASQKLDTDNVKTEANQIISQAQKRAKALNIMGGIVFSLTTIGAIYTLNLYQRFAFCPLEKGRPGEKTGAACFRDLKTSGEVNVFLSSTNFHLQAGIKAFKEKKFKEAIRLFEQAIDGDRNDPIPKIFLNNAKAQMQGNSLKLAAVTSVDYYETGAKEVLRGIADSQDEFNKGQEKLGDKARFMEIVIVNDENEPAAARKVAQELVNDHSILGIMGHHASESTIAGQEIYEKEKIAVISPTSSSSLLKGKNFFRSVGGTKKAAKEHVNYIQKVLGIDNLVVFYKKGSTYSETLKNDFKDEFKIKGGKVSNEIDINLDDFDIKKEVQKIINDDQSKLVLILSSVQTNSVAIAIATVINENNKSLSLNKQIKMFGSLALPEKEIFEKSGNAMEGMFLIYPCLPDKSEYLKKAEQTWLIKKISWRTIASYNTTQAFAKAINLSESKTRKGILEQLQSPSFSLSEKETAGFGLKWDLSDRSNKNDRYCPFQIKNREFVKIKDSDDNLIRKN